MVAVPKKNITVYWDKDLTLLEIIQIFFLAWNGWQHNLWETVILITVKPLK